MIPVVYICGPYRGPTREAVELNIQVARKVGALAAAKGWAPLIPHANCGGLDHIAPDLGDKFWLDATLELMTRCDAIVLCPGWQHSVGTQNEVAEARRLRTPIYWNEHELPPAYQWLAERNSQKPAKA